MSHGRTKFEKSKIKEGVWSYSKINFSLAIFQKERTIYKYI